MERRDVGHVTRPRFDFAQGRLSPAISLLFGFEGRIDVPCAVKYADNLDAFGARPIENHVPANDKASQPVTKFRPGPPHARLFR